MRPAPRAKFTRQHYEAVAAILARHTLHDCGAAYLIVEDFVEMFDDDNAMFDAARFRAACYPSHEEDA